MGVCETSSAELQSLLPATACDGPPRLKVVRPVGRSTLTPSAGSYEKEVGVEIRHPLTRPDLMGDLMGVQLGAPPETPRQRPF